MRVSHLCELSCVNEWRPVSPAARSRETTASRRKTLELRVRSTLHASSAPEKFLWKGTRERMGGSSSGGVGVRHVCGRTQQVLRSLVGCCCARWTC